MYDDGFEIFTAVSMEITVFWAVTPLRAEKARLFVRTYLRRHAASTGFFLGLFYDPEYWGYTFL
jgi:hypothetical protein